MKSRRNFMGMVALVLVATALLVACGDSGDGPRSDTTDIVIDPQTFETLPAVTDTPAQVAELPATPTPAEVTAAPTLTPGPTETLTPYQQLIVNASDLFYIQRKQNEAFAELKKAIEMDPTNPMAYFERGRLYLRLGKFDEAITEFNLAINYDPNFAPAWSVRGVAWAQKQQFNQAIADMKKAIEIQPNNPDYYINLGTVYVAREDYEEAMKQFNLAIDVAPQVAKVYFSRAELYKLMGLLDQAIADYTQMINLSEPDSQTRVIGLYSRGIALFEKGDYQAAFADLDQAIALDPESAQAYFNRGVMYNGIGEIEKARADLRRAEELAAAEQNQQLLSIIRQAILTLGQPTPTLAPTEAATPTP